MTELFRLPVINQTRKQVETGPTVESENQVERKIARAFLSNRYPLTEAGEALREEVTRALKQYEKGDRNALKELKERLPTVEHPHLELFQDFDLTPEQEITTFGPQLSCVQVSKGCRHQCEHCAADAGKKVEFMPFVAVLKIAEKMKEARGKRERVFEAWQQRVMDYLQNGPHKDTWREMRSRYLVIPKNKKGERDYVILSHIMNVQRKNQDAPEAEKIPFDDTELAFKIYEDFRAEHSRLVKCLEEADILGEYHGSEFAWHSADSLLRSSRGIQGISSHLLHYFDSDPFDYRDTTLLHENGTPADYGDVFLAHVPISESIFITTAGWQKGDEIARRAAEKIVRFMQPLKEKCDEMFRKGKGVVQGKMPRTDNFRVSLHPFERGTSHGDWDRYREDMKNVLRTLEPINPWIIFIRSDDPKVQADFVRKVVSPLLEDTQDLKNVSESFRKATLPKEGWLPVSHFSGRAEDKTHTDQQFDVMACMEGSHIWPNGSVLKQRPAPARITQNSYSRGGVEPGTRPTSSGFQLYQINRKQKGE